MQDDGSGSRVGAKRLGQYKARHADESERRREALQAQQNEARERQLEEMRRIAFDALLGGDTTNEAEVQVEVEAQEDEENDDGVQDQEDLSMEVDAGGAKKASGKKWQRLRRLHRTSYFARQLQVPDWMIEVPTDLASSWLFMVRPEGDRCLLLSDGGKVEVRRKNGHVLERYTDPRLPAGLTILDVVCVEPPCDTGGEVAETEGKAHCTVEEPAALEAQDVTPAEIEGAEPEEVCPDADAEVADVQMGGRRPQGRSNRAKGAGRGAGGGKGGPKGRGKGKAQRSTKDRKYAVLDALFWGDNDLACADAEFRMFWLASRFGDIPEKTTRRARPLQLVPAEPVTLDALNKAYAEDVGYMKDSLLFLHKEGHYFIDQGVTPLALQWRDRTISRFVVDTPDAKGEALPDKQAVVLELRGGGNLRTADRQIVATVSEEELKAASDSNHARAKGLVRCEVAQVDLAARKLLGLKVLGLVPYRSRVWPDSWGRIAYQCAHRAGATEAISFSVLQNRACGIAS